MITERDIRQLCKFSHTTFKATLRSHSMDMAYKTWLSLYRPTYARVPGSIKNYVNGLVSAYSILIRKDFCMNEADYNPIDKAVEKMFIRKMEREKSNT